MGSAEEVNHKEAYSDCQENQSKSVKIEIAYDDNASSAQMKVEGTQSEDIEAKGKFIEAPVPKVNPWTVNLTASNGTQKHNQPGK